MRILVPLFPVYNHRLGAGYLAALLRAEGHEAIFADFEHILRLNDEDLSLRLQDETEVYGEVWAEQVQFLHRPELLFGALWPQDEAVQRQLSDADRDLLSSLRPHVETWAEAMAQLRPEVVLLPALVSNLFIVLWASVLFHERAPQVPRILGGRGTIYAEIQELVLRANWADALLPGEAETTLIPLMDALECGRPVDSLATPGLVRIDSGRLIRIPGPSAPTNLDSLPWPDFSGLPFPGATLRYYSDTNRDFHDAVSVGGSRWCARRCAYCYESIYPKNYRLRESESVLGEIDAQRQRFGTSRLFFCDSTLNVSPPWLAELAAGMQRLSFKPQVVFAHCEPRRLPRPLLHSMRAAGFEKVNFGVESLDGRTLARMDRHTSVAETEETLAMAVDAGISLGLNLVSNYPGETLGEYESTKKRSSRLAERLRNAAAKTGAAVRFMVSQARVDPHSSLFVNRDRFGVRILPREIEVPDAISALEPHVRRIALCWTDGLPREERRARFHLMRSYIEGLSIHGRKAPPAQPYDGRVALDASEVPAPLAALIPELRAASRERERVQ